MKIANIVGNISNDYNFYLTKNKFYNYLNFYNLEEEINNNLPTLLLGYFYVSDNYNIDTFDKKINNKKYWTFLPQEKLNVFIKDFEYFLDEKLFNLLYDDLNIRVIDYFFNNINNLGDFLFLIPENIDFTYYNNYCYYLLNNNNLYIIDERSLIFFKEFINFDLDDLKKHIKNVSIYFQYNEYEIINNLVKLFNKEKEYIIKLYPFLMFNNDFIFKLK